MTGWVLVRDDRHRDEGETLAIGFFLNKEAGDQIVDKLNAIIKEYDVEWRAALAVMQKRDGLRGPNDITQAQLNSDVFNKMAALYNERLESVFPKASYGYSLHDVGYYLVEVHVDGTPA